MQINLESSHESITTPNSSKLETTDDDPFDFSFLPSFPLSVDNN